MYRSQYPKVNFSIVGVVAAIAILLSIIVSSSLQYQSVFAQNTNNTTIISNNTNNTGNVIDSFRAQGQISSIASDTLAGRTDNSTENVIWVLGGNWEFNVDNGNLTNFVVDIEMAKIDGTDAHKHTIEKLNNVTGMSLLIVNPLKVDLMTNQPSSKIALVKDNSTMFRGTADLTTNENIQWKDVPVHVTIRNGNVLNLAISPLETKDHFKGLPVFGIVQSIVDENGKEIVHK
ncbi:MAG: hypothetical protein L0H53_16960 [Candidatus Nitrosocosmicus sp.]|nr:hypothetical protein [Candidatus Nitrosocosmicus sp.]MDN5869031.1 hypothetical protein [Candidatus Nitrosocosmicus sp.]